MKKLFTLIVALTVVAFTSSAPAALVNALADNSGDPNTFASPVLAGSVPDTNSYAGVGSIVTGTTNDGPSGTFDLGSSAELLDGSNQSGDTQDINMAWRTRTIPEEILLASDVVDITGVTGTYVLQMSYVDDANGATDATYKLGYFNTDHSQWEPAVNGNSANLGTGFHEGAWNNSYVLGDFGVDFDNNVAWAVLDHNSQFAVVPAPAALPAGLALLTLVGISRRRKA